MTGSNRLPALLAEIKNANVVFSSAQRLSADAAFVMGKNLIEAKELCAHGDWSSFLKSTGIPPRTAQRYMRLAQSGFDAEYVAIVGVTEALREIDDAQEVMPSAGMAKIAVWDDERAPHTIIWWRTDRYWGGFAQAYVDGDVGKMLIIEAMPIVFIAFILDVAKNGLMQDRPAPERYRTEITFAERDRKLAIMRDEAKKFAEERA